MDIIRKEVAGDVYYGYYDRGIFHIHNENGPAIFRENGTKEWWVNGNLHKEDGPAIIYFDGTKEWWINHKRVGSHVRQWIEERNIDPDNLSEEDQLALSFYMRSIDLNI